MSGVTHTLVITYSSYRNCTVNLPIVIKIFQSGP